MKLISAQLTRAASWAAMLMGTLVLLGWQFDFQLLKRVHPSFVAMNPVTAGCFLLAGLSLQLSAEPESRTHRTWARVLAAVVFSAGLLKLAQVFGLLSFNIDQLLFASRIEGYIEPITGKPNHMAPNTALNFMLVGGALLALGSKVPARQVFAQVFVALALIITLIPVVGYSYGTSEFYGIGTYIPMALHTAFTFLVLLVGLLTVRPRLGIMQTFTGDSLGGVLARRVLPVSVLIPLVLGWLRLEGERLGLYSREIGTSLLVVILITVLSGFLLWYARVLHLSDLQRRFTEQQLLAQTQEMTRIAAYSRAIADVSKLLEIDLSPEEAARQTIHTICQVADVEWGGLVQLTSQMGKPWVGAQTEWKTAAVNAEIEFVLTRGVPKGTGMVWVALERAQTLFVDDYSQQVLHVPSFAALGMRSVAFVPLKTSSQTSMLFMLVRLHQPRPWTPLDKELLEAAARIMAVSIERQSHLKFMREAALVDVLTGLNNRRAFDTDLEVEMAGAKRHQHSLGVLMIDLDGLKQLNDREGHERGDLYLREFALALKAVFRINDRVYRLGGDEYGVILAHADPERTRSILDRMRKTVELVKQAGFEDADASSGVAFYPKEAELPSDLVRLADERMYEEKRDHHLLRPRISNDTVDTVLKE
ncbi:sensor domain-containing diguanylate cyclase [Deinococcus detaillensis]|uniref:Sensor domain-containing diguanylate cyclase n=1 Tax=Deinococcus detaillensis TaxID=2592048 RepID=A0A553UQ07_9DEIO|nr:sensor domain-containing diguanylate cyclase [Deinococcus detaillensis]TSA82051.1 sensor domain-containing diguanylate cyclase [Deinococcus detaillensis]